MSRVRRGPGEEVRVPSFLQYAEGVKVCANCVHWDKHRVNPLRGLCKAAMLLDEEGLAYPTIVPVSEKPGQRLMTTAGFWCGEGVVK